MQSIEISTKKPPEARVELEPQKLASGLIKPVLRKLGKNGNLYDLSDGLEQYRGFVVSDIDAHRQHHQLHQRRRAPERATRPAT